jgi:dTMP kinase
VTDRSTSILIAVEGIDGAGKTTQVQLLKQALEFAGESPVVSKEPTNGPWGRLIKESAAKGRLSPERELEAFLHDRTEHVETLILPALNQGRIVILDRYFYSSIAYQGSRGANVAEVRTLMESRFPIPDAVFILDVDPEVGIHRISHSRAEKPNEFEDHENLARARAIFNSIQGETIHHIDGALPVPAVHARMMQLLIGGALKLKRSGSEWLDFTSRLRSQVDWRNEWARA